MKEIPVRKGKNALVDDEDFEMLSKFRWFTFPRQYGTSYVLMKIPKSADMGKGQVAMHRLIMTPEEWEEVDHIDGDGFNNQKSNLRIVTHRQNGQNWHGKKTSRYPGVDWVKRLGKWRANIRINGKKVYLGVSDDEDEAFQMYKDACDALE